MLFRRVRARYPYTAKKPRGDSLSAQITLSGQTSLKLPRLSATSGGRREHMTLRIDGSRAIPANGIIIYRPLREPATRNTGTAYMFHAGMALSDLSTASSSEDHSSPIAVCAHPKASRAAAVNVHSHRQHHLADHWPEPCIAICLYPLPVGTSPSEWWAQSTNNKTRIRSCPTVGAVLPLLRPTSCCNCILLRFVDQLYAGMTA
ncbi:hypothetical protein DFH07DRAFT_311245 [Mycena maculata]|uniref:Uncharacterized protein n=1 Tax=Mycena maculata TaxID=230809 RepID=A0AAD7JRA3_9AGAR|nr:hypothetical protein DFH07DRAFT_311245 [Mycena maculata]